MKLFSIARLDNNETWTILERFASYEEADDAYDDYAEKYPNAYIDILEPA
jgi:peptide methionine sulfoxide reductase MsrA